MRIRMEPDEITHMIARLNAEADALEEACGRLRAHAQGIEAQGGGIVSTLQGSIQRLQSSAMVMREAAAQVKLSLQECEALHMRLAGRFGTHQTRGTKLLMKLHTLHTRFGAHMTRAERQTWQNAQCIGAAFTQVSVESAYVPKPALPVTLVELEDGL